MRSGDEASCLHKLTTAFYRYRSLSVLGWVPGIITMVVSGVLFWITSMTMHKVPTCDISHRSC